MSVELFILCMQYHCSWQWVDIFGTFLLTVPFFMTLAFTFCAHYTSVSLELSFFAHRTIVYVIGVDICAHSTIFCFTGVDIFLCTKVSLITLTLTFFAHSTTVNVTEVDIYTHSTIVCNSVIDILSTEVNCLWHWSCNSLHTIPLFYVIEVTSPHTIPSFNYDDHHLDILPKQYYCLHRWTQQSSNCGCDSSKLQ